MNTQPYPARLDGRLDPALSRWLWLVKWLLIVPHVVVLFFLWCAVIVLTARQSKCRSSRIPSRYLHCDTRFRG
jgi:hypothetical protein